MLMSDHTITADTRHHWENWGGNQGFDYVTAVTAASDDDVVAAVRDAVHSNQGVRVAGSGHSFTPIVQTDHTLLNIAALSGVSQTDTSTHRATVRAGTCLADVGAPLWEHGMSLANQGD